MLRNVSLFLARHDNIVSVVARNEDRLRTLIEDANELPGKINPIQVDYRHTEDLLKGLRQATVEHGPIIMVVNWMSADAMEASDIVAGMVNKYSPICRFFQVIDNHAGMEEEYERFFSQPFPEMPRVLYRTITLGLKVEEGGMQRLLNPKEVCDGIIDAVRNDRRNHTVGTPETSGVRTQSA